MEKAVYSIPPGELKSIVTNPAGDNFNSRIPAATRMNDVASDSVRAPEAGKLVPCRLSFPDLVVEKSKEKAFLQELSDQIRVALAGIGNEAIPLSVVPRSSDEDPVVVQMTIPLYRGEQLKSLLMAPALLSYTPLLKFGRFDTVYWCNSSGIKQVLEEAGVPNPAPDVLARLDELEKRYKDIKDRKNIVESFHEIMKRTNPYIQRMEALKQVEDPPVPFPGEDPPPVLVFPWSGVPGVLSPRAAEAPSREAPGSYHNMIDPSKSDTVSPVIRAAPPSASSVVAKTALDLALQQLSVDGVQLFAASSEISRRLEEAAEHAELTRIAGAGLVSPQVLEQLVAQSTLKREQARQKDELTVLKAWERDTLASVERENTNLYMQRLFALATGDEEALARIESGAQMILNPEEFRKRKETVQKQAVSGAIPEKISGLTVHVIRGSNLPLNADCFVRLRAGGSETQTSTVSDGIWEEKLYMEPIRSDFEISLYQYNSLGRDVLLARTNIAAYQVKDTNGQAGVWMLTPVSSDLKSSVSLSMRFDVETEMSVYRSGLQNTQNFLRERNMDFLADQVERVEEERRRLDNRIRDLDSYQPVMPAELADTRRSSIPESVAPISAPSGPSGLKEVSRPYPSYDSVYAELVELIKQGELQTEEGRQLAYDFSYLGQSKRDFEKKLLEYLSMQSDLCAKFEGDIPIQISGLGALCNMLVSVQDNVAKRRQISLVVWECALRNLKLSASDNLLGDQVLTSLALIVQPPRTDSDLIEFCIQMFARARELIQLEQIIQVLSLCRLNYKLEDQIRIVLTVLERFRFNAQTVERSLTALSMLFALASSPVDIKSSGSPVELVVVAAGMYADTPSVQVAAIEALTAMSTQFSDRIENLVGPVVIDQSLDRNRKNEQVQLGVARLLLRLADLRPHLFDVPEAVPNLIRIVADTIAVENTLVSLAAIRACISGAKNPSDLVDVSETVSGQFVSSLEQKLTRDASVAREACLTLEALVPNLKDVLVKAGAVSIPLKSVQTHSTQYPRLVRTFLSCLLELVAGSSRASFQLARMDGVQILMNEALYGSTPDWRALAILSIASCSVEETRSQFQPNEDIERLIALIDATGGSDVEVSLQAIRLAGEIAFNSSFSLKELFRKCYAPVNVHLVDQVKFPVQLVVWALLSKKRLATESHRFTNVSGKDLAGRIPDSLTSEFNLWVSSQGGAEAGASVITSRKKVVKQEQQAAGGLFSQFFGSREDELEDN